MIVKQEWLPSDLQDRWLFPVRKAQRDYLVARYVVDGTMVCDYSVRDSEAWKHQDWHHHTRMWTDEPHLFFRLVEMIDLVI